jgi:hypothetical protein
MTTPCASRAEPEIAPVINAGVRSRSRASDDAASGSRTVALAPDRSTMTSNDAVVADGVPLQTVKDVQTLFWQISLPVEENVIASVWGPLFNRTAPGAVTGAGGLGATGDPPQAPAISIAAARRALRMVELYSPGPRMGWWTKLCVRSGSGDPYTV